MTHVRHLAAAAAILCSLAGCAPEHVGPIELKFGHVGEPGSLFALSAEEFARRVNARLDAYEVVVFGSSQLGGDELLLQKIKLGTVDFALPSTVMSSQIEAFGLFEMPYLVHDRTHMRAIEEAVVWPDLAPLAEAEGYKMIAVWENGFRHVTNNEHPIVVPADLSGIKLRIPRGVWRDPYGTVRGIHRPADGCHRWAREPVGADLGVEVVRGPGVPVADGARVYAWVRGGLSVAVGGTSGRRA
jgi:TRAP-type transport system periplasmic protein